MPQSDEAREVVQVEVEPESAAVELHIRPALSRLVRGMAIYALANFGIKALNFLLLPLYTRFLTPSDYGIISLAEVLAAVVAALFGLGLDAGISRFYFKYVAEPLQLARYLSSVLRFALLATAVIVGIALLVGPRLMVWADPHGSVPFAPYVALAIGAAALTQFVQYRLYLYQAEAKPHAYALLALAFFLMNAAAAITLVVGMRWGALGMLWGKLLAALLGAAVAFSLLRKWLAAGLEWRWVRETLPVSLPLVPHGLMALGLVVADRLILERYRTLQEVGLYSLAYTLGMAMYLVTVSISQAWWAIYFDTARSDSQSSRETLGKLSSSLAILLAAVAVFGALIAQDAVRLLDSRYAPTARLIPWVIGGYLLHAFFGLFHLAALQGKRTQFILFASTIAFAANLALNLWWVPIWGMYGAAYATLAAYALEAAVMYVYAQRVFFLPYQWTRMAGAAAVFAGSLALTQMAWAGSTRPLVMLAALALGWCILWLLGGRPQARTLLAAFSGRAP